MWDSQIDLAWCAGFYEGEGTIHFQLQGRKLKDGSDGRPFRALLLTINQVEDYSLENFAMKLGIGKVTGPYKGRTANCKKYYQFRVTGYEDVQYVIASIWNWLSPRRQEQASYALQKYKEWGRVNGFRR